jgi:hypothetical protein
VAIPVVTFALTWAMHITDVRPAILRGIRTPPARWTGCAPLHCCFH